MISKHVFLIVCAVAIVIYILWKVHQHRKHKLKLLSDAKERLTDESVAKAQTEFERRLKENALPDEMRRAAFIYWNLMRTWFASLSAAKHYTDAGSDKLNSDWLDYMDLMQRRATAGFFLYAALETEKYNEELNEASRKMTMIEDGMAAAVGQEAVAQLEDVRGRPHYAFDRSGKKPMAPTGYRYFPTSPYVEEL